MVARWWWRVQYAFWYWRALQITPGQLWQAAKASEGFLEEYPPKEAVEGELESW